jgi:ABC-2 type transport system ATP-binding protein
MIQGSILEFKDVKKSYGKKNVICGLNFSISNNEIIALLGVNGAGKTTTIKLMLGQEIPTSGSIKLFGKNPQDPKSRISVGATPQNVEFPDGIKAIEILEFVHAHYPNPLPIPEMVEKFGLTPFLNFKASKISGGQKRRLALALAFIGNPNIVFLDEPTTGLDVESRKILLQAIKDYSKKGKTIFLTTHYLEEIEQIATRIIFLQDGQIKADGSVNEIKRIANSSLTKIIFSCESQLLFDKFHYIDFYESENSNYSLQTTNPDALIYELVENKIPFSNLQIIRENLESAFINLSKGK